MLLTILRWWCLLVLLISCCLSKSGLEFYQEGARLLEEGHLDEAAMEFWGAVTNHRSHDAREYTPADAFQQFLLCYQRQGRLAIGYAFVAAQMHQMGDKRAIDYLRQAHALDPNHEEILQLMDHMGETATTLKSLRRYNQEGTSEETSFAFGASEETGEACNTMADCVSFVSRQVFEYDNLECGWDDRSWSRYKQNKARLINTPEIQVTIRDYTFPVAYHSFWFGIQDWEPSSFDIFSRYIDSNTLVIDFGTWIGPTLLYHAQFSKKSYGLEADPLAFGEIRHNVRLQPDSIQEKIVLDPVAVVAPQDVGELVMKSNELGNSETFLTGGQSMSDSQEMEVRGYTLPYIMARWGILSLSATERVFIKMDIETYECRLLPSFHDWLSSEPQWNIVILVSFHPQLQLCTRDEMKNVLKTFQLFTTRVSCKDDVHVVPITPTTTFEEFEAMLDDVNCLTSREDSDFVLVGTKP